MDFDQTALVGIIAFLAAAKLYILLIVIAFCVFAIIGNWKLYVKAGQPGWKAIIPFYNLYTLVEMVGLNWYWFLIAIAPTITTGLTIGSHTLIGPIGTLGSVASILANVAICYNMSKKVHKDTGFVVLAVIFSSILFPVLGYSKNVTWDKDAIVTPNAFFDTKQ